MNPFARVVQQGKRGRLAVGSTWISEPTIEAESYCGRINTAFNARVDEEVKVALAHQEMELFSEKKIYESIEKAVSRAVAERDARIAALEKELSEWKESARVEAEEGDRARARIAELEKVLVGASEYIEGLAKRTGVLHGNIPEIRKALGKGER